MHIFIRSCQLLSGDSMRLIFLALVALVCGCICCGGVNQSPTTTTTEPSCPQYYATTSSGCCLDRDGNGVCDTDEATTTTVEMTTTTSTTSSSTTSSSSTVTTSTTMAIACLTNGDCGDRQEERICYQGDVFIKRTSPLCSNPGKANARCISKIVIDTTPTERCEGSSHCVEGECVND